VDRAVAAPRRAVVALGSNLGDRRAALTFAIERLASLLTDLTVSEFVETEPEDLDGVPLSDQPLYLNAAATGLTARDPHDLLRALQTIESDYGRERPYPGAPRTLDLDLILLDDLTVSDAELQLPHPRFRSRFFVLGPLAEIAPGVRDPVSGATVVDLLRHLLAKK